MVAKRKISAKQSENTAQSTDTTGDPKANHSLILLAVRTDLEVADQKKEMQPFADAIQKERSNIRGKMLSVAQTFDGEEFDEGKFTSWAEGEETFIKSDEAGSNKVDRLPRSWVQAKSDILNAYRKFGIRPGSVKNVHDLQETLNSKRKEQATAKKQAEAAQKDAQAAIKETVKTAESMDTQLAGRIGAFVQSYDKLSDADKDTAIRLMDVLISASARGELSVVYDYLHKASAEGIAEALGVLDADEVPVQNVVEH